MTAAHARGTRTMEWPTTTNRASDIFGSHTFSGDVMLKRLPPDVHAALELTMQQARPLDPAIANTVAQAMRDWAIEHGATHYCHWFQPLTGTTAEKHDAFLTPVGDGTAIEGEAVVHAYAEPGVYTVTHRVTDNSGHRCNTAEETFEVRVNAQPVAEAGAASRGRQRPCPRS